MRVAVISDIHANLPALEAVLAEVKRVGQAQGSVGWDEFWAIVERVTGRRPGQ